MAAATITEIARYKKLVLLEIGESDGKGPVSANVDILWDLHAGQGGGSDSRLQYLYFKRAAIDIILGSSWKGQSQRINASQFDAIAIENLNQLRQMRDNVQAEIANTVTSGSYSLDIFEPVAGYGRRTGGEF